VSNDLVTEILQTEYLDGFIYGRRLVGGTDIPQSLNRLPNHSENAPLLHIRDLYSLNAQRATGPPAAQSCQRLKATCERADEIQNCSKRNKIQKRIEQRHNDFILLAKLTAKRVKPCK
jgi:hypothetical protein